MLIIFCDSGFSHKEVDYFYEKEYQAAGTLGLSTAFISFEALKKGQVDQAVRRVAPQTGPQRVPALYRGWMLRPEQYTALYQALLAKNIQLITDPTAYRWAHHLPENYPLLAPYTPKSTWAPLSGPFHVEDWQDQLAVFGNNPILVKDYVKSQKHYWYEACYISDASAAAQVTAVVRRFLELQGEDFNEGLVFREFVPLAQLTEHSQSGMPLTKEFRLFIGDGQVLGTYPYWEEGDYASLQPAIAPFEALIGQLPVRFCTLDIAQTQSGDWIIVECGDGQVAGLPEAARPLAFYQQIQQLLDR